MFDSFKKKRKWISHGLFFVFLIGILSVGLSFAQPNVVLAASDTSPVTAPVELAADQASGACPVTGPTPFVCIPNAISKALKTAWSGFIAPATKMIAVKAIVDLASFAANRIAYESAVLLANGGPGEGSMFYKKGGWDAMQDLGKDVAGEAFAGLSDITKNAIGLDLCTPPNPLIRINIQMSIKQKYSKQTPRCNFDSVIKNWSTVYSNAADLFTNDPFARDQFLYKKLAEGLRPGNNELGATIGILNLTDENAQKKAEIEWQDQLAKSMGANGIKDVKNFITGNVETPASIVAKDFDKKLAAAGNDKEKITTSDVLGNPDVWYGLLTMSASTFTNTLTSQLFNRVYKGLFSPKPEVASDPFNTEAAGNADDLASTKADFGSIFTATPVPNPEFNLLSEFAQCPPDGLMNRGLNQCVMDASVVTTIARGNITVAEAIGKNVLNGDWPLISSQNTSANNDRLCYTYGFCYSNLVKLRKARIIPIGWEIAADKQDPANPLSLKKVMDAFNDCNTQGQMDADHKWCHLIDPNWVLKSPEVQCRASVLGEIRVGPQAAGRQSECADTATCIGEDNSGKCTQGFGYCVQEKNIWRIKGDECPAQFATCLTMKNTTSGKEDSYLLNTVDNANCTKQNAGCTWYKTQKRSDSKATPDVKDDSFEWMPVGDAYNVANRSDDFRYKIGNSSSARVSYGGANTTTPTYSSYSYEDRLYLTHAAKMCSQEQAGCTELNVNDSALTLNMIQNGSFENDEDKNAKPDGWDIQAGKFELAKDPVAFDNAVSVKAINSGSFVSQKIKVTPGGFYTFSYYASKKDQGVQPMAMIKPLTQDGTSINSNGLTYSTTTCTRGANGFDYTVQPASFLIADGWKRATCTFTMPSTATQVEIDFGGGAGNDAYYDGFQLQVGELATSFRDGYSTESFAKSYLKIAPAYLGCRGLNSDPKECASYAQVCSALDVGCNLFTPTERGSAVPAIASAVDQCPAACVGYDSYRQEGTLYEPAKFPAYFIASSAKVCPAQAVGCDGFTQLGTQNAEKQAYFTYLRACMTPDMTDANNGAKQSETYFTWEGSDKSGYQLQTWLLLKSNISAAPCTKPLVNSESSVICTEDEASTAALAADTTCNEHVDIFTNPDCREFFDKDGAIHYRKYVKTVSVDALCAPYRKDVSVQTDCLESGGYWSPQGFCKYFGLPKESKSCTAAQNGCRMYTGGAGRNATTILNETFENGSYADFYPSSANLVLQMSNDSVSTGGHSLRISNSGGSSIAFKVVQEFLSNSNHALTYDITSDTTKAATCTNLGAATHTIVPEGCKVQTGASVCIVAPGKSSCGPLTNSFAKGKVYFLNFWAKGSATLDIKMGNPSVSGSAQVPFSDKSQVELTNNWQQYTVGPIDTSTDAYKDFDQNAQLVLFVNGSKELYLDNLEMVQSEENITVIKDSWVTPASCDQTPDGVESPQYYLGCKAYTDRKGVNGSYYQFSHVCSEKAIGCSAYYNTANSVSPYGQVNNARCVNGALPNGDAVSQPTDCIVNSATYCTIPIGQSYCTFSVKQAFQDPLPVDSGTGFGIVYGPETVETPQDQSIYLVDNGQAQCSVGFKGCKEVGIPDFAQDQKTVKKFDSKYVIDDPETYGDILCENRALRCEEYSTTKDGNFYFKNPLNKTCEFKSSVTIEGKTFSGWFRSGTSEPCYWTDVNTNGKFNPSADSAYLVAGDQSQIWKNGDLKMVNGVEVQYDGWVGACESGANRCTELNDTTDTSPENHGRGKSYYVINNAKISEDTIVSSEKCQGRVGQKAGCALFNNTTVSQLNYNTNASYVLSMHADLLLSKPQNTLVDPISCNQERGVFSISPETAKKIGKEGTTTTDLCSNRCRYLLPTNDDSITTPTAKKIGTGNLWFERSCLLDSDCPTLTTKLGKVVSAKNCQHDVIATNRLGDDSNTVLKVNRDRTCAAWLACDSSRTAWDQGSNKYIQICDSVNLCTQTGSQGDQAQCQSWTARDPQVMTDKLYASRDVSWAGSDYAGYEIPRQLPVERYTQFNLNQKKVCAKDGVYTSNPCDSDKQCTSGNKCTDVPADFRLVYNAGACDSKAITEGGECKVGVCKSNGASCVVDANCPASGDLCVYGYCKTLGADCSSDAQCGDNKCDLAEQKCVTSLVATSATSASGSACSGSSKYVPATTTMVGSCFQDRCLTGIRDSNGDGLADRLLKDQADNTMACRGYPEIDSPFPQRVVKSWKTYILNSVATTAAEYLEVSGKSILNFKSLIASPSDFVSGYNDSKVCSPRENPNLKGDYIADDSCVCSYTKAVYGKGGEARYFPVDTKGKAIQQGVCTGGIKEGLDCKSDQECTVPAIYPKVANGDPDTSKPPTTPAIVGTCQRLTSANAMYGWQGYCLERDTSIHLNGTADANDQACLTWLPVDQLSGATDLYGKEMSAGFTSNENVFYCAEVSNYYDLHTSGQACAVAYTGAHACTDTSSPSYQDMKDDWNNDEPWKSITCPPNYFAVASSCGQSQNVDSDARACTSGETKFVHDAYPYICVPENSYHKDGAKCLKPNEDGMRLKGQTIDCNADDSCHLSTDTLSQSSPETVSLLYYGSYTKIRDGYYNDCTVKGVLSSPEITGDADLSTYADLRTTSYPACKSLAKVSLANTAGTMNAAWTNRVWKDPANTYKATTLNYTVNTEKVIFGQSTSSDTVNATNDPYPVPVYVCVNGSEQKPVKADGTCEKDFVLEKDVVNEARTFADFTYSTVLSNFDLATARNAILGLFAQAWSLETFVPEKVNTNKGDGTYTSASTLTGWDSRATGNFTKKTGDAVSTPNPPIITSVGNCIGTSCMEKNDGKFSVNGQDKGDITGMGGKRVSVTFFVHADKNQMPLRNVVVDWGDDIKNISSTKPWPSGSESGSTSPENFYKNHRGLDKNNQSKSLCDPLSVDKDGDILGFGGSPEACSPSYVLFNHDYVCTSSDINTMKANRVCGDRDPKTGGLIKSPCVTTENNIDYCVFQPRVHALDNWGWCTGYCDANLAGEDNTNSCFGDTECDIKKYPSGGIGNVKDVGGKIINPWVNYEGLIKIKPIQ